MNLAGDAGALIGDRPAELRVGDGSPDADQQDPVCEQAQEVALEHVVTGDDRRDHEVELGEEGQSCCETDPAVQVAAVSPVAKREAHESNEPEEGEKRRCENHPRSLDRLERSGDVGVPLVDEEGTASESPSDSGSGDD